MRNLLSKLDFFRHKIEGKTLVANVNLKNKWIYEN